MSASTPRTGSTHGSMVAQSCPNCGTVHDVGVYVSGQQVQCGCGIKFDVRRADVKSPPARTINTRGEAARGEAARGEAAVNAPVAPELDKTFASSRNGATEGPPPSAGETREHAKVAVTSEPNPPPHIPGFELVELLGKGGMGEVWRARQLSLQRLVAVKVLPSRFSKDPEFVARFDKEANALAALSHPGVVQIIDRGQAGDHYYFVMELVQGVNLRELMNGARPSVRDALRIGAQLARAVDCAHESKVVHRDLKPENVLVDARGHVKIADFGLAGMKGAERDIALTATAVAMGTVNYMAPEQRRDAKNVDSRADLYSLGVLLYELLTGELPLGRFKAPSQRVPGLDPSLDELIGSLLESDPAARPARANVVADALEALIPASSGPVPAAQLGSASASPAMSARSAGPASQLPVVSGGGWKLGVVVLAALSTLALAVKLWPHETVRPTAAPAWYRDAEDETFFSSSTVKDGVTTVTFESMAVDAGVRLRPHAGLWELKDGALHSLQYGEALTEPKLVPRAYVADSYYAAERFEASAEVRIEPLPEEFPLVDPKVEQSFAELAFRIHDTQVSVFALPQKGVELRWAYFRKDGQFVEGSSGDAVDELHADPVRVPSKPFQLRLKLSGLRNGDVNAEVWLDGKRVTRQVLPQLSGLVGKLAVGCRNASCRFDTLSFSGQAVPRPPRPER